MFTDPNTTNFTWDINRNRQLWDRDPADHHMAMVCLALLFTVQEREALRQEVPLLTVRDIVELLEIYLPRRDRTEAEVWAAMRRRHQARPKAIDSARRKQHGQNTTTENIVTK